MTWPSLAYKPESGTIPHAPGVYRFLDGDNNVIYVGKAKYLNSRLGSYFRDPANMHPRTAKMVSTATSVKWVVCSSESEALILEQTWIHQFNPRFNVAMRNGGGKYPSLAFSTTEKVNRLTPWRGPRKAGFIYRGPYPNVSSRDLIDALLRVIPVRSCTRQIFNQAKVSKRPCLLGDIGKCSAPCIQRIDEASHQEALDKMVRFLDGKEPGILTDLKAEMDQAAFDLDFEKAARRRDDIQTLEQVFSRQGILLTAGLEAEAVSIFNSTHAFGVSLTKVTQGAISEVESWVVEKDPLLEDLEQRMQILAAVYATRKPSKTLYLDDADLIEPAVAFFEKKNLKVQVRSAKSGDGSKILANSSRNAEMIIKSSDLRRVNTIDTKVAALEEIGDVIGVGHTPWRIECIDIAHTSGVDAVGSIVTFINGESDKSQYRRINIPSELGGDDYGSITHVVNKRFSGSNAGMSSNPDLLIIDGGPAQVDAALKAFKANGITTVALAGLAKRLEEIWVAGEDQPMILSRNSESLRLLQQLRDESHRAANQTHAKKRQKTSLASKLDTVPGLGAQKRAKLLQVFGTVPAIAAASLRDLQEVDGVGPKLAQSVKDHLN